MAEGKPFVETLDPLTFGAVNPVTYAAKKQAGLTWEEIAEKIEMSPVWTHSACMGMNAFPAEKAKLMVSVMGLPQEAESVLSESPTKIWEQSVPTDPCIYRLYEIVGVYGPTLKALIQLRLEIMSILNLKLKTIKKQVSLIVYKTEKTI